MQHIALCTSRALRSMLTGCEHGGTAGSSRVDSDRQPHLERRHVVAARLRRRGVVRGDAAHLRPRQLRVLPELRVQAPQQHHLCSSCTQQTLPTSRVRSRKRGCTCVYGLMLQAKCWIVHTVLTETFVEDLLLWKARFVPGTHLPQAGLLDPDQELLGEAALAAGHGRRPLLQHQHPAGGVQIQFQRGGGAAVACKCVEAEAGQHVAALQVADERQLRRGDEEVHRKLPDIADRDGGLRTARESDERSVGATPSLCSDCACRGDPHRGKRESLEVPLLLSHVIELHGEREQRRQLRSRNRTALLSKLTRAGVRATPSVILRVRLLL